MDSVEEMMDYIEAEFPLPRLAQDSVEAEAVTRNFFSKYDSCQNRSINKLLYDHL